MADPEKVLDGEVLPAKAVKPRQKALAPIGKSGQPADSTGPASALAMRQAMIDAAGYTVEDLERARKAKVDALDATDNAGNPDHNVRLKASAAIDNVVLPQVHGNTQAGGTSVLEVRFPEWVRKRLESKGSST